MDFSIEPPGLPEICCISNLPPGGCVKSSIWLFLPHLPLVQAIIVFCLNSCSSLLADLPVSVLACPPSLIRPDLNLRCETAQVTLCSPLSFLKAGTLHGVPLLPLLLLSTVTSLASPCASNPSSVYLPQGLCTCFLLVGNPSPRHLRAPFLVLFRSLPPC